MKKIIAFTLTLLLILTLAVPASAATTMRWNWGKALDSIGAAAAEIIRETEPATEPYETVDIVEETAETLHEEPDPEPAEEPDRDVLQGWREWLRAFMNRMHYGEG